MSARQPTFSLIYGANGLTVAVLMLLNVSCATRNFRAENAKISTDQSQTNAAHFFESRKVGSFFNEKGDAVFRIYSKAASYGVVELFKNATGETFKIQATLQKDKATNIFKATVSAEELLKAGLTENHIYYGFRFWGPNWDYTPLFKIGSQVGLAQSKETGLFLDSDSSGNRFNPNKLLLDPYGIEMSHDPMTPEYRERTAYLSGDKFGTRFRTIDSAPFAPKSILLKETFKSVDDHIKRHFKDEIIYEVHVKGLTANDDSLKNVQGEDLRGTYKGAGMKAAYLKKMGITAVEFLPVHEFQNSINDKQFAKPNDQGYENERANYWGYMTLSFFAPDRQFATKKNQTPGGPTREFREMVRAFHAEGIKVYIDVVYNHTAEGGVGEADGSIGFISSFRGIDNSTYYTLAKDKRFYYENTGTGNNLNTANPVVQELVLDSLSYYREILGVDGFRFDLAPVLGNDCEHQSLKGCKSDEVLFNYDLSKQNNLLRRIPVEVSGAAKTGGRDPDSLAGIDFIAEPWIASAPPNESTVKLGSFPAGWSEWNGKYRDLIRKAQNQLKFQESHFGNQYGLWEAFTGSHKVIHTNNRQPWASVNFLVAHDGFTLKDLYSCNSKNNNQPWPYGPSDGGEDDNHSWDSLGYPDLQRQMARTGLALLFTSAGVPMITGGDEMLRTMKCNNNSWNLDNTANWLNWKDDPINHKDFVTFFEKLAKFRSSHKGLRPESFYTNQDRNNNGMPDHFADIQAGKSLIRIDELAFDPSNKDKAILILSNLEEAEHTFTFPNDKPFRWHRVFDTAQMWEKEFQNNWFDNPEFIDSLNYTVPGRTVGILVGR